LSTLTINPLRKAVTTATSKGKTQKPQKTGRVHVSKLNKTKKPGNPSVATTKAQTNVAQTRQPPKKTRKKLKKKRRQLNVYFTA
jgi:hypothetical protein